RSAARSFPRRKTPPQAPPAAAPRNSPRPHASAQFHRPSSPLDVGIPVPALRQLRREIAEFRREFWPSHYRRIISHRSSSEAELRCSPLLPQRPLPHLRPRSAPPWLCGRILLSSAIINRIAQDIRGHFDRQRNQEDVFAVFRRARAPHCAQQ